MRRARSSNDPFVIAVVCEAGGTGKTTAAVGLAQAASRNGLSNTLLFAHYGVVGMRMVDRGGPYPALPGCRFLAGRPGDAAAHLTQQEPDLRVLDAAIHEHRVGDNERWDVGGVGRTLRRLRAEITDRRDEIVLIDAHSGTRPADLALALVADCLLLSVDLRNEHRSARSADTTADTVRSWLESLEQNQGPRWLRGELILQLPMRSGQLYDAVISALDYFGILEQLGHVDEIRGVFRGDRASNEPTIGRSTENWIPEQALGYARSLDDPAVQLAYDRVLAEVLVPGGRDDLACRVERAPHDGHRGPRAAPAKDEVRRAVNVRLPRSQVERWHALANEVGAQKQELLSAFLWEALELSADEVLDLYLRFRRAQTR